MCKLKSTSKCSGSDACCDSSTCNFKTEGTICRDAANSCDEAEVCSGSSPVCPQDVGKKWGTACTAADGKASTCWGKTCMTSLDMQCPDVLLFVRSQCWQWLAVFRWM